MTSSAAASSGSSRDPLRFSREEFCALIPHGGDMCLLERIEAWDSESILCSTDTHKDLGNPLRRNDRLSAVHGLEYGAQAMAVHGALLAGLEGAPNRGLYLAAVHELRLLVTRLDTEQQRLKVGARRLLMLQGSLVYQVRIQAGGADLLTARVTVMPRPGGPT